MNTYKLFLRKNGFTFPGFTTGLVIGGLNLLNINKSPLVAATNTKFGYFQAASISAVKGTIYGFFWPFSWIGMTLSVCESDWNRHFIPGSKTTININYTVTEEEI